MDNEKLIPGTSIWEAGIEKAIRATSAVVVFMSPDSKDLEWVRREISLADQYRNPIFPVLVRGDEDSSITLRLVTRQFVDLRGNEKTGLRSLHLAVSQYLHELNTHTGDTTLDGMSSTSISSPHSDASEGGKPTSSASASPGLSWSTLGWAFAGAISGFIYSDFESLADTMITSFGGALGGLIGGLVPSTIGRAQKGFAHQKNPVLVVLTWTIAGVIGWGVGWGFLTEAIGAGIGIAVFALIGLAGTLDRTFITANWKTIAGITAAWWLGGAIGWFI